METLLVTRFSAVGDVAMTIPVLYSFLEEYPNCRIIFLSRDTYRPLFNNSPDNLIFMGVDLKKKKNRGIIGLNRLYHELRCQNIDAVVDLHSVLRTWYLDLRFMLNRVPVARINKGHKAKQALCRKKNKAVHPLISNFERYRKTFLDLNYPFSLNFHSLPMPLNEELPQSIAEIIPQKGENRWIGIAPFARHKGKIYPLEEMEKVVGQLSSHTDLHIFLFGHGSEEETLMREWEKKYPRTLSFVNKTSMETELSIMSRLNVMLSMDSANMHLASLVGVPVVSIWGATSIKAGFLGWGQKPENCIERDLPCRPCSVYGNKPCRYKNYPCLDIPPQEVVDKILDVIK